MTIFKLDKNALSEIVRGVKAQAEAALDEVCEVSAAQMESSAKRNAPWTDRTGNARRTLEGFTDKSGHERYIGVCGNMFYSPSLEMLYGKKYAILYPVVQAETREVLLRLANKVIAVKLRGE
ncbi:MAG: hypothetical protein PUB37_02985 [Firmicutes bacterium]|nr:hypothetical protein [Bacillota bacterium]